MSPCLDDATLHALLDRALPAPEAAACERHLALCADCRRRRDAVAHARDAVTALLAGTAGPRRAAPAFATLVAQAAARRTSGAVPPLVVGLPQPETRTAATAPARRLRTRAPISAMDAPPARRVASGGLRLPAAVGLAAALAGFGGWQLWTRQLDHDAERIVTVFAAAPAPETGMVTRGPQARTSPGDAVPSRTARAADALPVTAAGASATARPLVAQQRMPAGTPRDDAASTPIDGAVAMPYVASPAMPAATPEPASASSQDDVVPAELVAPAPAVATVRIEALDGSTPLRIVATDPAASAIQPVPVSSASRLAAEEAEGRTARPVRTSPVFGAARTVPHPFVNAGAP